MRQRSRPKAKRTASDDEGEAADGRPVVVLSSSDDEANEDLSLAIAEKARQREKKRRKEENRGEVVMSAAVVDLSTSSDEPDRAFSGTPASFRQVKVPLNVTPAPSKEVNPSLIATPALPQEANMVPESIVTVKKKSKKKKKNSLGDAEKTQVDASITKKELAEKVESMVTISNVVNTAPENNVVLQKLLRGPRYFDLEGSNNIQSCFNCGEEGHLAANCPMEKRQKPCYVCGLFGHSSKQCLKEKECFICRQRGHRAKDCPEKLKKISPDSKFCLRCGDVGHEMSTCNNEYPPDDLKEIQCYICKKFGHLCCADFIECGPIEVSCYNCAQSGHSGLGCGRMRGETNCASLPIYCYRCNEEGHFARGCTKSNKLSKWNGEMSTPKKFANEKMKSPGHGSAPHDLRKASKKESVYEERRNMTAGKVEVKNNAVGDHADHMNRQKNRGKMSTSYIKPGRKIQRDYSQSSRWHGSSSWVHEESESFIMTPSSHVHRSYNHSISRSRFSNSHNQFGRT